MSSFYFCTFNSIVFYFLFFIFYQFSSLIGVTGLSAGLTFQWSCVQTDPIISSICGISMPVVTNVPVLTLTADASTLGTSSIFTVSYIDNLSLIYPN